MWKRSNIHDIRVRASFQKKEKKERILLEISNIHDNRVISKERKKMERILWGILNIHDIRMGASFQKKERKKGKDIVGDIEYT